jgi:predicted  nucleic acid-binding Zn-ribbon protein
MDAGKKQYELSKLNRKLQQDLDKTDNTKAQKELLKLQKEIEGYQESGVEMSERDLTAL